MRSQIKENQSKEIEEQIQEFLKRGGKIQECEIRVNFSPSKRAFEYGKDSDEYIHYKKCD